MDSTKILFGYFNSYPSFFSIFSFYSVEEGPWRFIWVSKNVKSSSKKVTGINSDKLWDLWLISRELNDKYLINNCKVWQIYSIVYFGTCSAEFSSIILLWASKNNICLCLCSKIFFKNDSNLRKLSFRAYSVELYPIFYFALARISIDHFIYM